MDQELILIKSPLFREINTESITSLLKCLNPIIKTYYKNHYLLNMDDSIPGIGIVLDGTVQILKEDYNANRIIMDEVAQGAMFAENLVCAEVEKSPVYVKAITDCRIMWLDLYKVLSICSQACEFHQQLVRNLLKITAQKSVLLNEKIDILSQKTIREKILTYLRHLSMKIGHKNFTIPFSRTDMADFLCIDRSALSRELSHMKEEGLIEYHKNNFVLL